MENNTTENLAAHARKSGYETRALAFPGACRTQCVSPGRIVASWLV